jgi:hypothetical protein
MGAGMPAGLMLRNRMVNGFITKNQVLSLSREDLAKSGPVVASVTARAVEPLPGSFAGIIVRLDGADPHDRTPADDPATNPLSQGIPNFDYYSIEVVQRIGYDSFCPDNGVLLAKNKDKESRNGGPNGFNCFNWVIDAHPEDIDMVDYIKPDGQKVKRTIADYRQLNDALFHAGLNSGSQFEWEDTANRLHFYIIDAIRNENGIISYKIGVRSLDGSDLQKRDVNVTPPLFRKINGKTGYVFFTVANTGEPSAKDPALHHQNTSRWLNSDIYRLSVKSEGTGCSALLLNELISLEPGEAQEVPVYISFEKGASRKAKLNLTIQSESGHSLIKTSLLKIKSINSKGRQELSLSSQRANQ